MNVGRRVHDHVPSVDAQALHLEDDVLHIADPAEREEHHERVHHWVHGHDRLCRSGECPEIGVNHDDRLEAEPRGEADTRSNVVEGESDQQQMGSVDQRDESVLVVVQKKPHDTQREQAQDTHYCDEPGRTDYHERGLQWRAVHKERHEE